MSNATDADVLIIGAGAAGLAAARSLARRALRVIVLEGRDRDGGRAWTLTSGKSDTPLELGAEFIHGPAPGTTALLRDAGAKSVATGGAAWRLDEHGTLERADDDFVGATAIFEDALTLPDETVDEYLRRFDGNATTRKSAEAARAFVEGFDAADPAIASSRSIAQEWASGTDFASARPVDGYVPVFDQLRKGCADAGVRVMLSTVVRHIDWRPGAVEVRAFSNGGAVTYRARAAVITIPVGVLRSSGDEATIAFDPPLPAVVRNALSKIESGHVVRVVLQFRSAFWRRLAGGRYDDAGFFRCADKPFPAYWTQFPIRNEQIVAWVGGPKAAALHAASTVERIELALSGLMEMFSEPGTVREEFVEGVTHDWSADVFARGAYSYVAVNGGDARAMLATPIDDTLFIAGEATADNGQGGTVNGALETGERAARQAAKVLGVDG